MLNPDTSSDSPSARSKGVRFVSAKRVINHIRKRGRINSIGHETVKNADVRKLYDWVRRRQQSKIRDILTSYEIVWATPRKAPIREYLELEAHPAEKVA